MQSSCSSCPSLSRLLSRNLSPHFSCVLDLIGLLLNVIPQAYSFDLLSTQLTAETHLLGRTPFPPFLYCLMPLNAVICQMIIICVTSTQIRDRWTIGRLRRKWKILTLAEFEPCRCQDFIRPSVVEPSIQMGRVMPLTSLSSPSSSSSL